MLDPTDLAAADDQRAKQTRLVRRRREIERAELRRLLSSELGRTFVMRLIERAGVFRGSFDMNAPEATHLHAFREGCRNEGLRLLTEIVESCPENWPTMLKERAARKAAEEMEEEEPKV